MYQRSIVLRPYASDDGIPFKQWKCYVLRNIDSPPSPNPNPCTSSTALKRRCPRQVHLPEPLPHASPLRWDLRPLDPGVLDLFFVSAGSGTGLELRSCEGCNSGSSGFEGTGSVRQKNCFGSRSPTCYVTVWGFSSADWGNFPMNGHCFRSWGHAFRPQQARALCSNAPKQAVKTLRGFV